MGRCRLRRRVSRNRALSMRQGMGHSAHGAAVDGPYEIVTHLKRSPADKPTLFQSGFERRALQVAKNAPT